MFKLVLGYSVNFLNIVQLSFLKTFEFVITWTTLGSQSSEYLYGFRRNDFAADGQIKEATSQLAKSNS